MFKKKIKNIIIPNVGRSNKANRERWLKKVLDQIPQNSRILDAGAGTQQYKKFCKHLIYVSQDFAEYDGKGDMHGLQTGEFDYSTLDIVSDIISIPVNDNSFDAIMCVEILEHVPEPSLALKELMRILKPGGKLILTAPFNSLSHYTPYHFSTGFNKYWYNYHLEKYNGEIISIEPNGNYFEYIAQEVYRIPNISKKYTKKKFANVFLYSLILPFQIVLRYLSKKDNGSEDLLCHGYHVLAKKNDN